jgi:hypothetical protein
LFNNDCYGDRMTMARITLFLYVIISLKSEVV